ncbi:hypothetical protein N7492_000459 [Penicillium capsulatum]|uniref:Phosphoglycerate mutase family protein n=1 Tax=Penicillium capsulatum TaxID=69766 RepID=A0A9W9LYR6_9EURO|nr:hypothetical protein N7492_000459 [Penicillium capsulatum]KAJ6130481.1 hypothetical protein N7512_003261 [Penicillium capsulatum]
MVLQTIYLTRHGFRANWSGEDPKLHSSGLLPPDTPLSEHGESQAGQLGVFLEDVEPQIDVIYSSPFYRCVQTVEPAAERISSRRGKDMEIRPEPGVGEWYGADRENDPKPAPPHVLKSFFPMIDAEYQSIWTPDAHGERIEELHNRAAYVLARMIKQLDEDPSAPTSVLICTHAATFVAICRVLTGSRPSTPDEADFIPWTCGITKFKRRIESSTEAPTDPGVSGQLPHIRWDDGGVSGGWECTLNGFCGFLLRGRERGWRFSGKETFSHDVQAHGLDSGTGLGVIIDGDSPDAARDTGDI